MTDKSNKTIKTIKTIDQIEIIDNNLMSSIYNEVINREGNGYHAIFTECVKNTNKNTNKNKTTFTPIIFEAGHYNIYKEYTAMTNYINIRGFRDNYEKGRYKVIEFMLNCIIADPINGDYYEEKNSELIKEAGRLLHTENAMHDGLVWSFIPKRFERDIDVSWNGIGEWRS